MLKAASANPDAKVEAAVTQEVELKLELAHEAVDSFLQSAILPAESEQADLRSIYFDTPDRQLHAEGLSLRIRQSGTERVQTVKADEGDGGGGLFARAEWEMKVSDDVPVIDTRTPVAALLGEEMHTIEPAFAVEVGRRSWLLSEGSDRIEMALDQGMVRAGERQAPICEIELERKAGEAAALFRIARDIDAQVPVRLGVIAKSERGYQLLEAVRHAFKAEPVRLTPGMRTDAAFQTIARACLRHYRLNEALLLEQYDPLALHQARVAVRRLRSAFTIFKPILAEADRTRFQEELRWLAGMLGEARDLDVLAEQTSAGDLRDSIEAVQPEVHARVIEALHSHRVRGLLLDLLEWLTLGAGQVDGETQELRKEEAQRFAARRLAHLRRKVVKDGRGMKRLNDAARHEVRKDAKKLRYASEFFAGLFPQKSQHRRHARFIAALEGLQDDLGALNDLVSMPRILAQYGLIDRAEGSAKRRNRLIAAAADAHGELADAQRFWR